MTEHRLVQNPELKDLHGQSHITDVVPRQPLRFTQQALVAQFAEAAPPQEPIKTTEWVGTDTMGGHAVSKTITNCTLTIQKTGEMITVPMWTGSKALDMSAMVEARLQLPAGSVTFYAKQGCSTKNFYPSDQLPCKVFVRGVRSFKRLPDENEHPFVIIGAGHVGLRTGMQFLDKHVTDFVIFDRMKEVGGTSWWLQANSTSKLQTEYGVYHLDWGPSTDIPKYFKTPWPSRDDLLQMFIDVTNKHGLRPHCRLSKEVCNVEVVNKDFGVAKNLHKSLGVDHYVVSTVQTDGDTGRPAWSWKDKQSQQQSQNAEEMLSSGIMMFPGNLTLPRREDYKGEEDFGGQIEYGMFGNANYADCHGADVMVVGHGAFAVENVRTCCEFKCKKIYLVCRRTNISCPRVVSWFANRSINPVSGGLFLRAMKPMYDLLNRSVWDNYAVKAGSSSKSTVSIEQKARFGIGDIYFLAGYYGKMEVIIDPGGVKRLSYHEVTLASGRKLENVKMILKLLGFVGEPDVDRLMKLKELVGFWVNSDPRRYLVAEPVSVLAQNFGGTSLSPGALAWAQMGIHYMLFPQDFSAVIDTGMLPRHAPDNADADSYRPAYVVDARHGLTTGSVCPMTTPMLGEEMGTTGWCKPVKQRLCHPIKQFVEEAKADWDHYCKQFIEESEVFAKKPYPTYPYSVDIARAMVMLHMKESREPVLMSDIEDLDISRDDIREDGLLKESAYRKYLGIFDQFPDPRVNALATYVEAE